MAVQVFQDEGRADGNALEVSQHLRWFLTVVDGFRVHEGLLSGCAISRCTNCPRFGHYLANIAATAHQAAGNRPLECREVQGRTSRTYQSDSADFLDALNRH